MGEKKNTYILGISAFYHDSSACLFKNDELVFACEEEKFTGIKHDDSYPQKTISFIFKKYGLSHDNIDAVCFYEDPQLKKKRILDNFKKHFLRNPIYSIQSLLNFNKNRKRLKLELDKFKCDVFYSKHHDSHLYYSSFSSDFKKSLVFSIDGVGETDSTCVGVYNKNTIEKITISEYPHSLGLFYSAMTSFLGFRPNEGEYKVMGLSAYGKHDKFIHAMRDLIWFKEGKVYVDMSYFTWDRSNKIMFSYKLSELLNTLPRQEDSELKTSHYNLAAATQKRYEEVFFEILNYYGEQYPDISNVCLGGGCAYNGLANGKIYQKTKFKHVWIPPSPSDGGSSIGSCTNYIVGQGRSPKITKSPFLGPSFNVDKNYKHLLGVGNSIYLPDRTLLPLISRELKKGKVIAWFRGNIEFGARALGNRSILADPTKPNMKDRINKLVKKREGFRPFAPMVTKERQKEFFEVEDDIPYMNQVVKVKDEYRSILPSVTHVDGTARVQTVTKDNPIHNLLREFEKVSSYPILLNTSFNVKDKTMVMTPKQAIETLKETDIDMLVLQNILIFNKKK